MKYYLIAFELILLGLITYLMVFTPSCLEKKKKFDTPSFALDKSGSLINDSCGYIDRMETSNVVHLYADSTWDEIVRIDRPIKQKKAKVKDIGYWGDGDGSTYGGVINLWVDSSVAMGYSYPDTSSIEINGWNERIKSKNFILDIREAWTKEPFNTNFILRREGINMAEMNATDSSITIHGDTMKLIRYLMNEILNYKNKN